MPNKVDLKKVAAQFRRLNSKKATDIPDFTGRNVLMGFWHNWPSQGSPGYQMGAFKELPLNAVPAGYNVIAVAFMKGAGVPTFSPYNVTDEVFQQQVAQLNAQGRAVLISLGGADAHIELHAGQEEPLAAEIVRLVETYGFDGLDIDLEQAAITAGDNRTVIPAALKRVKDHYREENRNFIISMAPEFPYLRAGGNYLAYVEQLEGYYDFIAPQFYNQGGDGLWIEEIGKWVAQNDDSLKEEFLFYLTESLVSGTRDFIRIPPEKFIIGLPSNVDAAATGYVRDGEADPVANTLQRLKNAGKAIKGLMTWSVNWDDGLAKDGTPYGWEFVRRYAPLLEGEGPGTPELPSAPSGLRTTGQTVDSISLAWNPSTGPQPILAYQVYRNQRLVGEINGLTFTDTTLAEDTLYTYHLVAMDANGAASPASDRLTARTQAVTLPGPDAWVAGSYYATGAQVTWRDEAYTCLATHTAREGWEPDRATSLWKRDTTDTSSPTPRHGRVITPRSRAVIMREDHDAFDESIPNSLEAGKFFPQTASNLTDPHAPQDSRNALPPADGKIASAGNPNAAILDEPGAHWAKHSVQRLQALELSWNYSAVHRSRRWNYFITKPDWNPDAPLARSQFDATPFHSVQLAWQPHWEYGPELTPANPTVHTLHLPDYSGYHVLLAVWEVADTAMAFYQVIDLDFGDGGEEEPGEPPQAPSGLHVMSASASTVELMWDEPVGGSVANYKVHRDGEVVGTVLAGETRWMDTGLGASTTYQYFVAAVDAQGRWSLPSDVVTGTTEADSGGNAWALNTHYHIGDEVTWQQRTYRCLAEHIAKSQTNVPDQFPFWAPLG